MSKIDYKEYLRPIWEGNIICNESICFYPEAESGEIKSAPLLFSPTEIISVRSADLKTEFVEGKDYVIENGAVCLVEGSRMKPWEYDEYYTTDPGMFKIEWVKPEGRYINWARGSFHADHQYAVTYKHANNWNGPKTKYSGDKLPKTAEILKNGGNLRVLFYGDSITEGSDASGFSGDFDGAFEPYMPIYPELVIKQWREAYPDSNIEYINTAVGGWNSSQGVDAAEERVAAHNPDLVIIGFGMNDLSFTPEQHKENIMKIMETVLGANPDAEFILISTSFPNPGSKWYKPLMVEFQPKLEEIVKDRKGTALVPMSEMHKYLMSRKRYSDMSGNGINHPNDFFVRIYAQTMAALLIPEA